MQSTSKRFPKGLGNDSGELGHNIMDHHLSVAASAKIENYKEKVRLEGVLAALGAVLEASWEPKGRPMGVQEA